MNGELKIKRLVLTILLWVISMVSYAQATKTYVITGKIGGLQEGERVVMYRLGYDLSGKVIHLPGILTDSGVVKNGTFKITGNVAEGPAYYMMRFRGHKNNLYRILIDNGEQINIQYDGDIRNIKHQVVDHYFTTTGSPSNHAFELLNAVEIVYGLPFALLNKQLKNVQDTAGFDKPAISGILNTRNDLETAFYNNYLDEIEPDYLPAMPSFAIGFHNDSHAAYWAKVYGKLDDHLRDSNYGKQLKQKLALLIGQAMPDFNLPASDGSILALKNMVNKGKVTLVHFWAVNSYNRKAYDRELRALYKQYHDKGLNIIGVSTDSWTDQWKETLANESYPWFNVVDLKGKSVVDPVYHELGQVDRQNTTNVLLDQNGKILAWDVSGVELQWYLSKLL